MPDIDTIRTGLNGTRAALGQAQAAASTADARAEQIARHAAASGFTGIATGMNQVRHDLSEIRTQLAGTGTSLDTAATALAGAPRQMSPEETITALTPVQDTLTDVTGQATTIAQVDAATRRAAAVLRGGQPGPMLAALQGIIEALGQLNQRATATREHVQAAIGQARQVGDTGK